MLTFLSSSLQLGTFPQGPITSCGWSRHSLKDVITAEVTEMTVGSKIIFGGLPWWPSGKESALQCRGCGFDPWSGN